MAAVMAESAVASAGAIVDSAARRQDYDSVSTSIEIVPMTHALRRASAADRPADAAPVHADAPSARCAPSCSTCAPTRASCRTATRGRRWRCRRTGVVRVTVPHGSYIVPPSRALWIPPGVEHAVTVVEDAELLTLYLHQPRGRCGPAALARPSRRGLAPVPRARGLEPAARAGARARRAARRPRPTLERATAAARAAPRRAACSTNCAAPRRCRLGVDLPHDKRLRASVRGGARRADAPRHARRLGRRRRRQPAHRGAPVPQRARHVVRAMAPAGAAGARRAAGRAQAADGDASPPSSAMPARARSAAMVRRSVGAPPSRFLRVSGGTPA